MHHRRKKKGSIDRYLAVEGDTAVITIVCRSGARHTARLDAADLSWIDWTKLLITGNGRQSPYLALHTPGGLRKLHTLIMKPPPGMDVDHINFDTLDNRRQNLRCLSSSENRRRTRRWLGVEDALDDAERILAETKKLLDRLEPIGLAASGTT